MVTQTPSSRYSQIHLKVSKLLSHAAAHDLLDLAMATVISVQRPGPLVWLLLIGPPSCGKTETVLSLKPLKGDDKVHYKDKFSAASFASGAHGIKGETALHLLPQLNNKCFIVKDMAPLFSLHFDKVKDVLGTMTAIYDGELSVGTGTQFSAKEPLDFTSRFSGLYCTTTAGLAKHQRYMSDAGSRFLGYRVPALTEAEQDASFDLMEAPDREQVKAVLAALVREHVLDALAHPWPSDSTLPPAYTETLRTLAKLVSRGRTAQRWRRDEDGKWAPDYFDPEGPARIYGQLRTLLLSLSTIRGGLSDDLLDLVRRVAIDTLDTDRAATLATLRRDAGTYERPAGEFEGEHISTWRIGILAEDADSETITGRRKVSARQLRNRLWELEAIGLVEARKVKTGTVGNAPWLFSVRPEFEGVIHGSFKIPPEWFSESCPEDPDEVITE